MKRYHDQEYLVDGDNVSEGLSRIYKRIDDAGRTVQRIERSTGERHDGAVLVFVWLK